MPNATTVSADDMAEIEQALGDAYAYRLGEAYGLDDPDLDPIDREHALKYLALAERLGLVIS